MTRLELIAARAAALRSNDKRPIVAKKVGVYKYTGNVPHDPWSPAGRRSRMSKEREDAIREARRRAKEYRR